jgi:hypothetical protein
VSPRALEHGDGIAYLLEHGLGLLAGGADDILGVQDLPAIDHVDGVSLLAHVEPVPRDLGGHALVLGGRFLGPDERPWSIAVEYDELYPVRFGVGLETLPSLDLQGPPEQPQFFFVGRCSFHALSLT